jgi:YVTN family beta-propeller protein
VASPKGVTASPNGQWVYVTSEEDNQVAVIDTASGKLIKMLEVGARPRTIAFLPDSSRAYVTAENGGNRARDRHENPQRDPHHQQVPGEVVRPMGATSSPDGKRLYVTTGRGTMLVAIDTATNVVAGSARSALVPGEWEITPDGRRLYTANGPSDDVSVVDAETMTVIATVPAGRSPWGVAIR